LGKILQAPAPEGALFCFKPEAGFDSLHQTEVVVLISSFLHF